eukprot:5268622-Prymnesium_polylepis.1
MVLREPLSFLVSVWTMAYGLWYAGRRYSSATRLSGCLWHEIGVVERSTRVIGSRPVPPT